MFSFYIIFVPPRLYGNLMLLLFGLLIDPKTGIDRIQERKTT